MNKNNSNKKRFRKRNWLEVDDVEFTQVWAKNYEQLRGPRKKSLVHEEMAAELYVRGIDVSAEDVRNKISNLTKKYRSQKQDYDTLYPFVWPLYNAVHDIIGAEEETVKKNKVLLGRKEVVAESNLGSEPLKLFAAIQLPPIKCESPSLLESPTVSPPPSPVPKLLHAPSPAVASTSASTDKPGEQAIDTLLTVVNRLSENYERHLLQSLVVEKQKLQELRAIRYATKKLSNGILEFLKNSSSSLNKK